jgi:hypothetical protein
MSFNLQTVQDYITDARTLLLDRTYPYRYGDDSLLVALNLSLLDARRLRSDLFVYRYGNQVPSFESVSGDKVPIEPQFRKAIIYGLVAHALFRDEEDVQDQRANSFLSVMEYQLTGSISPKGPAAPIRGGTPAPGNPQT